MKLWLTTVSGNSYKIRTLCSILKAPCEMIYIDPTRFEHKQRPIIDMNPRGQVPVMEIEGKIFWDSTAHLTYIARKWGGEQWLPTEPLEWTASCHPSSSTLTYRAENGWTGNSWTDPRMFR